MGDTTIIKVDSAFSPTGHEGLKYLACGKTISMRLWDERPDSQEKATVSRPYETVGFVLEGRAQLEIEGQTVELKTGDSWIVPKGSQHRYRITERFKAVEATHPPFQVHARDSGD
jgi:uncharacterized cupin superfamily protein